MAVHVYEKDTKIVLMGWFKVVTRRSELRHMELSLPVADELLEQLSAEENELAFKADQLLDVLCRRGQDASFLALASVNDKVTRTLVALSKMAWEREVPFSVDEMETSKGSEYFDSYESAYLVEDLDNELEMK